MNRLAEQKLNLLTEANELTSKLLVLQKQEMDLANELYPSFDNWIIQMGNVNRINQIVEKAIARAKRRALFFTQTDDSSSHQKAA